MAMKKNVTQQRTQTGAFSKTTRKPAGTRLGTLEDWRGCSSKPGKVAGRYGCAVRDGR
jgi:hypothetical protein